MNELGNRELWLLGGALVAVGALLIGLSRRRRKSPHEIERERRLQINATGRIAEGSLVQVVQSGGGRLLCYQYTVAGVTYNAAQDISALRHIVRLDGTCEGVPARVKYDPQNPSDSIVVCEAWSGLR